MKMKMGAVLCPSWDTDQTQGLILFPGMFWSSGVEFSSDQRSDNLHTDMVFLLRHKQHYVNQGRDIRSFGLHYIRVTSLIICYIYCFSMFKCAGHGAGWQCTIIHAIQLFVTGLPVINYVDLFGRKNNSKQTMNILLRWARSKNNPWPSVGD